MSTLTKTFFGTAKQNGITLPAVPKPDLADFIAAIRKRKQLTLLDIKQASGGRISENYIHELEQGKNDPESLSVRKIKALAKGMEESPFTVFARAGGIKPDTPIKDEGLKELLEGYLSLPAKDREEMRFTIELLRKEVRERRSRLPQT